MAASGGGPAFSGYIAYGINASGRFGHPRAISARVRQATGFQPTAFGTPAALERYRATHIPPVAAFGTPLLVRTDQC